MVCALGRVSACARAHRRRATRVCGRTHASGAQRHLEARLHRPPAARRGCGRDGWNHRSEQQIIRLILQLHEQLEAPCERGRVAMGDRRGQVAERAIRHTGKGSRDSLGAREEVEAVAQLAARGERHIDAAWSGQRHLTWPHSHVRPVRAHPLWMSCTVRPSFRAPLLMPREMSEMQSRPGVACRSDLSGCSVTSCTRRRAPCIRMLSRCTSCTSPNAPRPDEAENSPQVAALVESS